MNPLLNNIFEQPTELKKVLRSLQNEYQSDVYVVAETLKKADKIILSSMGSAYYSMIPMYYALNRQGKNVRLEETAELLRNKDKLEDAVYILMSRSGESYEVAALAQVLKEKGLCCISITMTPDSTMAKNSSYVLYDCSSYDDLVCTKAYTSLALCGLVCSTVMEKGCLPESMAMTLEEMFDWMENNKRAIQSSIETIEGLRETNGFYCISRSVGMGVIQSASLWIEEETKKCCGYMSIDNFYHGPVEVVSSGTLPIFLDVQPDSRSEMIWDCICKNAGTALYIGPEGRKPENCTVLNYPLFQLDAEYIMLMQALFFQLLAYQCAAASGVVPGKFDVLSCWVVK